MGVARAVHRGANAGRDDGGVWAADDAALAPALDAEDGEGREVAARDAAGDVDARGLVFGVLGEVSEHVLMVHTEAVDLGLLERRERRRGVCRYPYGGAMPNSNYRVDFDGRTVEATYYDAQRILSLQTLVIVGDAPPQEYTFQVAGDFDAPNFTVFIGDPNRPLTVTAVEIYRRDQE